MIVFEAAVQAEAPEAICPGISLVGFLTVTFVIALNRVYHTDANFVDKMVSGIQGFTVHLGYFQR
jgi:hypothetical protein